MGRKLSQPQVLHVSFSMMERRCNSTSSAYLKRDKGDKVQAFDVFRASNTRKAGSIVLFTSLSGCIHALRSETREALAEDEPHVSGSPSIRGTHSQFEVKDVEEPGFEAHPGPDRCGGFAPRV